MTRKLALTAVYEPVEDGWIQAYIEELPGVVTAAPTLDEAKEMLLDALHEYLLALGTQMKAPSQSERTTREAVVINLSA